MKETRRALAFTSLGHFANDGTSLLYPILITFYLSLPGVQLAYLGSMAVVFNLISGGLSTPIGRYADRTGKYGVLISVGIALLAISVVILSLPFLFPGYIFPLILVASVFLGAGQAFYHPLGAAILRNAFTRGDAPKAMGINGSFGSLGRAVVPTSIGFLMGFIGPFTGMIIYSFYNFALAGVLFLGLRKTQIQYEVIQPKTTGNQQQTEPVKEARKSFMPFVYMLTTMVFIRALFLTGTSTFIPTYLSQQFDSRAVALAIILIAYSFPVIGQPIFGTLTSRKGGKYTVVVTSILSTLFFGFFLISGTNLIATISFYALFAFLAFSGFPVLLGYVGQVVPREKLGLSNALVWGVGQTIGGAFGAGIVSLFTIYLSVTDSIRLTLIFAIVALVFLPFLPSKSSVEKDKTVAS